MKRYVSFTEKDSRLLQEVSPLVKCHLPALADRFYDQIAYHPEAARAFLGGQQQIDHLKQTLQAWAQELLDGPHDEDYAAGRCRIGQRRVAVGLPERYMISSRTPASAFPPKGKNCSSRSSASRTAPSPASIAAAD